LKFLCLICAQTAMERMSEADAAKHYQEYREFTDRLRRDGHLVDCNRLMPPDNAVTLRVRDGKVAKTDGPFIETKEHLGGYYLIEARDLSEAVRLASGIPGAKIGCVEVRPIADDEPTLQVLGRG
jgi:hypothetical protein